jgi:hypothetical protein
MHLAQVCLVPIWIWIWIYSTSTVLDSTLLGNTACMLMFVPMISWSYIIYRACVRRLLFGSSMKRVPLLNLADAQLTFLVRTYAFLISLPKLCILLSSFFYLTRSLLGSPSGFFLRSSGKLTPQSCPGQVPNSTAAGRGLLHKPYHVSFPVHHTVCSH